MTSVELAYTGHPAGIEPVKHSSALEALGPVTRGELSVLFDVGDELICCGLRRSQMSFLFVPFTSDRGRSFVGSARWPRAYKAIIVPLNFAAIPDVSTLFKAECKSS